MYVCMYMKIFLWIIRIYMCVCVYARLIACTNCDLQLRTYNFIRNVKGCLVCEAEL